MSKRPRSWEVDSADPRALDCVSVDVRAKAYVFPWTSQFNSVHSRRRPAEMADRSEPNLPLGRDPPPRALDKGNLDLGESAR